MKKGSGWSELASKQKIQESATTYKLFQSSFFCNIIKWENYDHDAETTDEVSQPAPHGKSEEPNEHGLKLGLHQWCCPNTQGCWKSLAKVCSYQLPLHQGLHFAGQPLPYQGGPLGIIATQIFRWGTDSFKHHYFPCKIWKYMLNPSLGTPSCLNTNLRAMFQLSHMTTSHLFIYFNILAPTNWKLLNENNLLMS